MMGKANGHSRCVPCESGEALQTDFALIIDEVQRIPVGEIRKIVIKNFRGMKALDWNVSTADIFSL